MTWLRLVSNNKGRWNDPLTKAPPQYENWRRGKYAETEDNCAFLLSGDIDKDGKWSSSTCTEQSPRLVFINKSHVDNWEENYQLDQQSVNIFKLLCPLQYRPNIQLIQKFSERFLNAFVSLSMWCSIMKWCGTSGCDVSILAPAKIAKQSTHFYLPLHSTL